MAESSERANFIRRYLLGQASPQDHAAFEEQYFADEDVFEDLTAAENDLIDDFVRGALSRDDRAQFLSYFLTTPERRERVAFARSLFEYAASETAAGASAGPSALLPAKPPHPMVIGRSSFFIRSAASFTAVLALVAVIWLVIVNNRLRNELQKASAQQQKTQRQDQELHRQISELTSQLEIAAVPGPGQAIILFTLTPNLERGTTPGNVLSLPLSIAEASLVLKRKPEERFAYSAVLETVEGREVWKGGHLPARATANATIVMVRVPSNALRTGDYILKLTGTTAEGKIEELDPYAFRVLKH